MLHPLKDRKKVEKDEIAFKLLRGTKKALEERGAAYREEQLRQF